MYAASLKAHRDEMSRRRRFPYAFVCGCVAWASPLLSPLIVRLGAGLIVGVIAVLALPVLRRATGL
jgi:hypothetical protein